MHLHQFFHSHLLRPVLWLVMMMSALWCIGKFKLTERMHFRPALISCCCFFPSSSISHAFRQPSFELFRFRPHVLRAARSTTNSSHASREVSYPIPLESYRPKIFTLKPFLSSSNIQQQILHNCNHDTGSIET